jgi:hypothetical protein
MNRSVDLGWRGIDLAYFLKLIPFKKYTYNVYDTNFKSGNL